MNPRFSYVLVGLFVLLLGAGLIGGVLWFSGGLERNYTAYRVYMSGSVTGLSADSPVEYHGVGVGRVAQIGLTPGNPSQVQLLLEIQTGTPIKADTVATLQMMGLTGITRINLVGGSSGSPLLEAKPGEKYPVIQSKPPLLGQLDSAVSKLLANLSETSRRLNQLLDEDNRQAFHATLTHLQALSATLDRRAEELGGGITDLNATLGAARRASTQLPALLKDADASARALGEMAEELRRTGTSIRKGVDANAPQVRRFVQQTLPEVESLVDQLNQAAANFHRLSERLAQDPSALLYGAPPRAAGPGE
jgi:phospholipid/cholesterol/gamma-HCH transport system substrate-binding protein